MREASYSVPHPPRGGISAAAANRPPSSRQRARAFPPYRHPHRHSGHHRVPAGEFVRPSRAGAARHRLAGPGPGDGRGGSRRHARGGPGLLLGRSLAHRPRLGRRALAQARPPAGQGARLLSARLLRSRDRSRRRALRDGVRGAARCGGGRLGDGRFRGPALRLRSYRAHGPAGRAHDAGAMRSSSASPRSSPSYPARAGPA